MPALFIHKKNEMPFDTFVYSEVQWIENGGREKSDIIPSRIKYRGKSARLFPQKSYGLRFSEKISLLGFSDTSFILIPSFLNASLARNKLVYDLFRSMHWDDSPRFAPHLCFVEVFINGRYEGIYELTEQITSTLLGLEPFQKKNSSHSVLYKVRASNYNFKAQHFQSYSQKEPDPKVLTYWEPYNEWAHLITNTSQEEFRERVSAAIDLKNMIDFHLLLNLAYNKDGTDHNLFMARDQKKGSPFFFVPWDYDRSFELQYDQWLSNKLLDRLLKEVPPFKIAFKERWEDLRKNQLAETAILARIAEIRETVKNAGDRNSELWPIKFYEGTTRPSSFTTAVQELQAWIHQRLLFLDTFINAL
jgi:hypothetical protein